MICGSRKIAHPIFRARIAGIACSKKIHTCAPLPGRDRSRYAGTRSFAHVSTNAIASSCNSSCQNRRLAASRFHLEAEGRCQSCDYGRCNRTTSSVRGSMVRVNFVTSFRFSRRLGLIAIQSFERNMVTRTALEDGAGTLSISSGRGKQPDDKMGE
jgi:hypothetical protein